jgi:hypothetical protein
MKCFNTYSSNFSFKQHLFGNKDHLIHTLSKNLLNKLILNKQEAYEIGKEDPFDVIMPDSESYSHLLMSDSTYFQTPVPFKKSVD